MSAFHRETSVILYPMKFKPVVDISGYVWRDGNQNLYNKPTNILQNQMNYFCISGLYL